MLDVEDSQKIIELQEYQPKQMLTFYSEMVWDLVFSHELKAMNFGCGCAQNMLDCVIYPGSEMIANLGQQILVECI